jgi:hypothetical protein
MFASPIGLAGTSNRNDTGPRKEETMTKPSNWQQLPEKTKQEYARELLTTTRAHMLLGQALAIAVMQLRQVDADHREYSNIEDMEILSMCFEPHYTMTAMNNIRKGKLK